MRKRSMPRPHRERHFLRIGIEVFTVKYNSIILAMLLLLAGASASSLAAQPGAASEAVEEAGAAADKAGAQAEKAAAQADKATAQADQADADAESERSDANMKEMEAQLEAARARLEQAAHEVAALSARMSMPLVRNFLALGGDEFSRAIIGVELDPASGPGGARIEDVSPGGPAADAGLRRGDVIVSVNGTEVKGHDPARQVAHLMRNLAPDSKVKVGVLREGKSREFVVTARRGLVLRDFPGVPAPPGVP